MQIIKIFHLKLVLLLAIPVLYSCSDDQVDEREVDIPIFNNLDKYCNFRISDTLNIKYVYMLDSNLVIVYKDSISIHAKNKKYLSFYDSKLIFKPCSEQIFIGNLKSRQFISINLEQYIFDTLFANCSLNMNSRFFQKDDYIYISNNNTISVLKPSHNKMELAEFFKYTFQFNVLNIYPGLDNNSIIVETGVFPSGGVERLVYFTLNPFENEINDVTNKIEQLVELKTELTPYYDNNSNYLFHSQEKFINNRVESYNDLILNSNLEIVGKALPKSKANFGFYSKNGVINYYLFRNYGFQKDYQEVLCYPINQNFEHLLFNLYYSKLINKEDCEKLDIIQLKLMQGLILRKYNCIIEDQDIKNILSFYSVYSDHKDYFREDHCRSKVNSIDNLNLQYIDSLIRTKTYQ